MKYSLRQLEVFLAVAHFENITRAAQRLSMSQSAASSALKELEQQFDIQLFDRVGKRLQLNELGRLIRPKAAVLLAQAEELEVALQQHQQPGDLSLGATLSIGNYLAVDMMARYMAEQPAAKVTLEVGNTAAIAQKVVNFELDVGLVEGEVSQPELEIIPWRQDELVVFCSPDHPLAQRKNPLLSDKDLAEATWILRETGSGTRQTFDRIMSGILPELNILLELQHTEAIKHAVAAGLGLGCLSRITLEESFNRGALVPLVVAQRNTQRWFYFVLHKLKYRSAGVSRWLEICQQTSADRLDT